MTKHDVKLRYDEGCLVSHALNLIGDRWALQVVRELVFGPKRFQMIRAGIPGITASVLTARLTQLAQAGVVHHDRKLGIYMLTDAGHGLLPVLESLCRWAMTVPGHDPTRFISPSALMISMGVNLVATPEEEAVAGFDFGNESFRMTVRNGKVQTVAMQAPDTPFVLKGSGNGLAFAIYGTAPLVLMIAKGFVSAEGDLSAAQGFVNLFRLGSGGTKKTSTG
ncbi:winged helix-turn-helix transcriptional regulator [Paracoccus aerodenitrificans]|uniref:winged helix-turn-helix transcriptional regulator n=1 Tax=Paracoccus aerodenitrificans TaxID=3017781 RepID=UPI0022F0EC15|nr:helix-turn-helix domain-containing protein [Paracoccus aerodenitrificans]WBU64072.1 helix-turn-helix domain-containing protein [Paracoccus aerodenitrificans]